MFKAWDRVRVLDTDNMRYRIHRYDRNAIGDIITLDERDIKSIEDKEHICPESNKYRIDFDPSDFVLIDNDERPFK